MGFCSSNPFAYNSHLLAANNLSRPLKGQKLLPLKGKFHGSKRAKVVAFYGLTTPPYKLDSLEPYMSQRALEIHWGERHRNYVEVLNQQLGKNDALYGCTMEELIRVTYNNGNPLSEFNAAAEVWNHDFFWESMQPDGGYMPGEAVLQQIEKDFGSFTNFREKFVEAALSLFGSGWIWLVLKSEEKRLAVVKTSNAVNPLIWNDIPIIGLDMWEHAYYLDYRISRGVIEGEPWCNGKVAIIVIEVTGLILGNNLTACRGKVAYIWSSLDPTMCGSLGTGTAISRGVIFRQTYA